MYISLLHITPSFLDECILSGLSCKQNTLAEGLTLAEMFNCWYFVPIEQVSILIGWWSCYLVKYFQCHTWREVTTGAMASIRLYSQPLTKQYLVMIMSVPIAAGLTFTQGSVRTQKNMERKHQEMKKYMFVYMYIFKIYIFIYIH